MTQLTTEELNSILCFGVFIKHKENTDTCYSIKYIDNKNGNSLNIECVCFLIGVDKTPKVPLGKHKFEIPAEKLENWEIHLLMNEEFVNTGVTLCI